MTSLPPLLLETLLTELSTLASVYHKPAETFVGKGRYGADAIQHAAIQEQRQDAVDNPIAASAVVANIAPGQNNENLLDIDFDGGAPANGGEVGTPVRVETPVAGAPPAGASSMADMMGLFDDHTNGSSSGTAGAQNDIMNGFAGLDLGNPGASQPPPSTQQSQGNKKTNEDLLGMF